MQENTPSAIKLFGKKIPLATELDPSPPVISGESSPLKKASVAVEEDEVKSDKELSSGKVTDTTTNQKDDDDTDNDVQIQDSEDSADQETLAEINVNPKTPSINEESAKSKNLKTEKEQSDGSNEKTLKKPDKILPCPRCSSMDTKFCYYNNYNINQPRHFCKACQRYWTAGGSMRNVPVGAGRRKNKNSASHYRHITISEALQAARIEAPNGSHNPVLKTNCRVLSFGLESPICDSMASVLHLADKKIVNGVRNGFHHFEDESVRVPCKGRENVGDDCSSGSSVTVSNSIEEGNKNHGQESVIQSVNGINGFAPPIPCLPGVPWPYPWNSALPPPPAAFCPPPPGYPMSFYPPFWNCHWNIPMSPQSSSTSSNQKKASNPLSPTLGKHSRDGEILLKHDNSEKEQPTKNKNGCVLVPKTLRIDDPNEAAKSSIWTTLGIKNESFNGSGLIKAFQPKSVEKKHVPEPSPLLRANPAALSRSINFHEST